MKCSEATLQIHEYLDGDLQGSMITELNSHIGLCADCRSRLRQLEQAEGMLRSLPKSAAPDGLTQLVMQSLPQQAKKRKWTRWIRNHPAASVAAMFFVVMMTSFLTYWNQGTELIVRGADLDQVVFQGNTVIVPEGHTIRGNLTVENGSAQVNGNVNGNVVVIDGKLNLASTAHISGEVTKINQAFDWLWYKLAGVFKAVAH